MRGLGRLAIEHIERMARARIVLDDISKILAVETVTTECAETKPINRYVKMHKYQSLFNDQRKRDQISHVFSVTRQDAQRNTNLSRGTLLFYCRRLTVH